MLAQASMMDGLHDVIPAKSLAGLTADDLQLLLSGRGASLSMDDWRGERLHLHSILLRPACYASILLPTTCPVHRLTMLCVQVR